MPRAASSGRGIRGAAPRADTPDGDLVYELKTRWTDGTTAVKFSHGEFLKKLAALIPPPHLHLSRHFGVQSSHRRWRSKIVCRQAPKGADIEHLAGRTFQAPGGLNLSEAIS